MSRVWILPDKPSDMDLVTWIALLRRSGERCEERCQQQCDTRLEVDHIHSRGLGGETSLKNCRLLCASKNRERGMSFDPRWEEFGYFDNRCDYEQLRTTQRLVGPDMIRQYADLFIADNRKKLLDCVSLFVL